MRAKTKTPAVLKEQQRQQRLEDCAYAAYQMENGDYPYPKGIPRGHKKPDGTHDWNRQELMRLFGWPHSQKYASVIEDPHFKKTLEYHRWRGSDPTFKKKIEDHVMELTVKELFLQVYEQVTFHPDTVSYDQKLKTIKTYIDCGLRLNDRAMQDRTEELLSTLDERERAVLVAEQRKELERQLDGLQSLGLAVEGAPDE